MSVDCKDLFAAKQNLAVDSHGDSHTSILTGGVSNGIVLSLVLLVVFF